MMNFRTDLRIILRIIKLCNTDWKMALVLKIIITYKLFSLRLNIDISYIYFQNW